MLSNVLSNFECSQYLKHKWLYEEQEQKDFTNTHMEEKVTQIVHLHFLIRIIKGVIIKQPRIYTCHIPYLKKIPQTKKPHK